MTDKDKLKEDQKDISAPENGGLTVNPDKKEDGKTEDAWTELGKTIILAVFLALIVRTLLFEPFNIPSGSMKPTLLIGDYLFVSKTSYGYSQYSFPFSLAPIEGRVWTSPPEQGDIVVFKLPSNPHIDYIKRIVALPGDTVQIQNGRLYLNGTLVPRQELGYESVTDRFGRTTSMVKYRETLPNGVQHFIYEESDSHPLDNTKEYKVPEDHVFVMGDNRDNSQDSRVEGHVGPVPFENLVGRAEILFFSVTGDVPVWKIWAWPWAIRYGRIFNSIRPQKAPGEEA